MTMTPPPQPTTQRIRFEDSTRTPALRPELRAEFYLAAGLHWARHRRGEFPEGTTAEDGLEDVLAILRERAPAAHRELLRTVPVDRLTALFREEMNARRVLRHILDEDVARLYVEFPHVVLHRESAANGQRRYVHVDLVNDEEACAWLASQKPAVAGAP